MQHFQALFKHLFLYEAGILKLQTTQFFSTSGLYVLSLKQQTTRRKLEIYTPSSNQSHHFTTV